MDSIKEKIQAEMENIEKVLSELGKVKDRPNKELVVLVGIGAYLQNIYAGVENILKQLLLSQNIKISDSPTWHKDLLISSVKHNILSKEMADRLGKYLFFRHFFIHAYGFVIEEERLKPLMDDIACVYSGFKKEIEQSLSNRD